MRLHDLIIVEPTRGGPTESQRPRRAVGRRLLSNKEVTESSRVAATAKWRATLAAILAAAITFNFGLPHAIACECAPPPPPCEAYWQTPAVFLGTVTEALATKDGRVVRARMRIDHAFKGVSEKTVVLYDDGMCDGPDLQVGEQYLMYTQRPGDGDVPSRGCTRSRNVKAAKEDLKYLNGLAEAPPTSEVFGSVVVRTDDVRGDDQPLSGAVVSLNGAAGAHTTTTDAEGRYAFEGLAPAKYAITSDMPGYRMLQFSGDGGLSATVESRGCAAVNMIVRRTWQALIEGRVIRANGEPAAAGIDLTLIQLDNIEGEEQSMPLFGSSVNTNERGEYSFSEVAPGRYKIAMNLYRFPDERDPYPELYWPGARNEADALVIEVGERPAQRRYDFNLPPEPKAAPMEGTVLTSDGKPAQGVQVFITIPNNARAEDSDGSPPRTDADGHFSFLALEGFEYALRATQFGTQPLHSAALSFTPGKGAHAIVLVLDRPGRFDNDPIVRDRRD